MKRNKKNRTAEIVFNLVVISLGLLALLYGVAIYFTPLGFTGG